MGSPVSADSSTVAGPMPTTPSTGMTSPARTSSLSPTAMRATGMSSTLSSRRRCATRGARSTRERRSCSARETAMSSSMLPPEYISATTAPASGWPSASAAVIERSAIASTPSRPASKSRTIETAKPATTGSVASVQQTLAKPGSPATCAKMPAASPTLAIATSNHRRKRSTGINAFFLFHRRSHAIRWRNSARP